LPIKRLKLILYVSLLHYQGVTMYKIAINGFGRIGRNIVRALYERPELQDKIKIVAINDLGSLEINAHLLQFDSVHGRFNQQVEVTDNTIVINGDVIHWSSERNPADLPWSKLGVDLVCECTGVFTSREKAALHLAAGAKKVLISAPGADVDATVVFGVNDNVLDGSQTIISNASCTTNCLAPMGAKQFVVQEALEIIVCEPSSTLSLTPNTTVASTSAPGAEISTFLAPAARWSAAFSREVNTPVHSQTRSTPSLLQGRSAGLRSLDQ
jgi:glyceraldehyde-3-phosphate dehydrogenase type I